MTVGVTNLKKEELRNELLKRGANRRTLINLQKEVGLEFFSVPLSTSEYVGVILTKVDEGILEIPYRMIDMDENLEELVIGAEKIVDEERIQEIQQWYISQQEQLVKFCYSNRMKKEREISDYLSLAEKLFYRYKEKRIHYQDVWRYLEQEPECLGLDEDIMEAIETYIRYNLFDHRITDVQFDEAKEILKKVYNVLHRNMEANEKSER